MSKIFSLYQNFKKKDNTTIYFFKSGIFYIAIAEDATFLSNMFGFKITKLNDTVVKCGFPVSSVEKYSKIFSNNNLKFTFINTTSQNSNISAKNNNDEILKLINTLSEVDTESLSVLEIYNFLEKLKQNAIKIKKYIL